MTETKPAYPRQIVIAWTVIETVWDREMYAADLGERPGLVEVEVPRAVTWLFAGDADDVAQAEAAAKRFDNGARVYTFGPCEQDPHGRAKAQRLKDGPAA
jgi:hypothetical protein